MKVSLKDIAKKCGCSTALASSIINNKNGNIKCRPALEKKIRNATRQMNYISTKEKSTYSRTVVFLTMHEENLSKDISDRHIFRSFSSALSGDNIHINTLFMGDSDFERKINELHIRSGQSCFVIIHHLRKETEAILDKFDYPRIYVNFEKPLENNCIMPDEESGCDQAVKLLASYNVRKIVYVENAGSQHVSVRTRKKLLCEKCSATGIEIARIIDISQIEKDPSILKRVVEEKIKAIVTYGGYTKQLSIILKCFGLKVPEDIGIMNLGGEALQTDTGIFPTFVYVPFKEMGEIAASMVLRMMNSDRKTFTNIVVPEHIVIGNSIKARNTK